MQLTSQYMDAGAAPGVSEACASDYLALLKPRVMSLVVFTAITGLLAAPAAVNPAIALIAIICIAVGAGASASLNMWYDADIDRVMTRTRGRPIPAGLIQPDQALAFGILLSFFSVVMLGLIANWLSASLLAFTIFFYVVVYTMWLKRSTPQNIVIGGAAGALPPVIGWAVATGGISLESILLFLIVFVWTPPHFWSLALFKSQDYERAKIPMLPNVAGAQATRRHIFLYALILAPLGVVPYPVGLAGPIYGVAASLLGLCFVWMAGSVLRMSDDDTVMRPAKRLFGFSILYLFALFAMILIESVAGRMEWMAGS